MRVLFGILAFKISIINTFLCAIISINGNSLEIKKSIDIMKLCVPFLAALYDPRYKLIGWKKTQEFTFCFLLKKSIQNRETRTYVKGIFYDINRMVIIHKTNIYLCEREILIYIWNRVYLILHYLYYIYNLLNKLAIRKSHSLKYIWIGPYELNHRVQNDTK